MIVNNGSSPEQAVLGRASKLPGSLLSDEDSTTHHMCLSHDPASKQLKGSLELRTAARAAFWHADNHAAIRRAALHRSRGVIHEVPVLGQTKSSKHLGKRAMARSCTNCMSRVKNHHMDHTHESVAKMCP